MKEIRKNILTSRGIKNVIFLFTIPYPYFTATCKCSWRRFILLCVYFFSSSNKCRSLCSNLINLMLKKIFVLTISQYTVSMPLYHGMYSCQYTPATNFLEEDWIQSSPRSLSIQKTHSVVFISVSVY